jgi:hypothetical protein
MSRIHSNVEEIPFKKRKNILTSNNNLMIFKLNEFFNLYIYLFLLKIRLRY